MLTFLLVYMYYNAFSKYISLYCAFLPHISAIVYYGHRIQRLIPGLKAKGQSFKVNLIYISTINTFQDCPGSYSCQSLGLRSAFILAIKGISIKLSYFYLSSY